MYLTFKLIKNEAFRLYFDTIGTINRRDSADALAGQNAMGGVLTSIAFATVTNANFVISKDGGAFAQTTNAPVEISTGRGYVDLTATEMNADTIIFSVNLNAGSNVNGTNVLQKSIVIYTTTDSGEGEGGGSLSLSTELTDDGVLSGNGTVGDVLKALFYFLKKNRNRKTITR